MGIIVNTIDVLGDDILFEKIVNRSITEFNDDIITAIGKYAFNGCSELSTVNVPNITSIDTSAFADCSTLDHIYAPAVVTIGDYAFMGCSLLETAIFPNVTTVGQQSFTNCSALTLLDLRSVESIKGGRGLFVGCKSLSTLILGNTEQVVTVSGGLSLNATHIGSGSGYIYVPSALIDDYKASSAFSAYASQIRALEDYTVDGTTTGEVDTTRCRVRFFDEDGTFLCYVMIPNGGNATYPGDEPTKEGEWAFTGWSPAPTNVTTDMDCYAQFRFTGSFARQIAARTITSYEDDVVEKVRDYAFYGCSQLTTADCPSAISIGGNAFEGCSKLETVNFQAATSISGGAFTRCTELTSLVFPEVTSIGNYIFNGCSALTRVDFYKLTSLGTYVFTGCVNINTLILRNTAGIATLSATNAFTNTPINSGTGYIYVPRDLVDSYKSASNWSTYANQFRAIEDYPDICGGGN
jgi:hypothetical protein